MVKVRGCHFPDEFYYDVPHHTWYMPAGDSLVRAGMTCVGVALAREVLVFTPRHAGRDFEKGRSFATVESAKWVGAVRSAFEGTVVAVNEAAMRSPGLINSDCYGDGWLLLVRPTDHDWRKALVTGAAIAESYEAWMEADAFPGCNRN